jgi:hypothetical protein
VGLLEERDLPGHLVGVENAVNQGETLDHGADRGVLRGIDDPRVGLAARGEAKEVVVLGKKHGGRG